MGDNSNKDRKLIVRILKKILDDPTNPKYRYITLQHILSTHFVVAYIVCCLWFNTIRCINLGFVNPQVCMNILSTVGFRYVTSGAALFDQNIININSGYIESLLQHQLKEKEKLEKDSSQDEIKEILDDEKTVQRLSQYLPNEMGESASILTQLSLSLNPCVMIVFSFFNCVMFLCVICACCLV